ncbi:hypothetical protein [Kocuria rhizophila]|uniref:hypothetical protein n=1 Tax=Kocuria rhizophila TaxID=72000 RepID=UPI0002FFBBB9|nr:hypothetical protein [Kocuria rhizophila]
MCSSANTAARWATGIREIWGSRASTASTGPNPVRGTTLPGTSSRPDPDPAGDSRPTDDSCGADDS